MNLNCSGITSYLPWIHYKAKIRDHLQAYKYSSVWPFSVPDHIIKPQPNIDFTSIVLSQAINCFGKVFRFYSIRIMKMLKLYLLIECFHHFNVQSLPGLCRRVEGMCENVSLHTLVLCKMEYWKHLQSLNTLSLSFNFSDFCTKGYPNESAFCSSTWLTDHYHKNKFFRSRNREINI